MLGHGALSERALSQIAVGGAASFSPENDDGGWSLSELGARLALAASLLVGPAALLAQQPSQFGAANDAVPVVASTVGVTGQTVITPVWWQYGTIAYQSSGADQFVLPASTFVDDDPGYQPPQPWAALTPAPVTDSSDVPALSGLPDDGTGQLHVVWPGAPIPAPIGDDPVIVPQPTTAPLDDGGTVLAGSLWWHLAVPVTDDTAPGTLSGAPDYGDQPTLVVWPVPSVPAPTTDDDYVPPPAVSTVGATGQVIVSPVWWTWGTVVYQSSGADQWVPFSTPLTVEDVSQPVLPAPALWPLGVEPVLDDPVPGTLAAVPDHQGVWEFVQFPPLPIPAVVWDDAQIVPQPGVLPVDYLDVGPLPAPQLWPLPPVQAFTDDSNLPGLLSAVPEDWSVPALVVWPVPPVPAVVATDDWAPAPVVVLEPDAGYSPAPLAWWAPVPAPITDTDVIARLTVDEIPAYVAPIVWPFVPLPQVVTWDSADAGSLTGTVLLVVQATDQSGPRYLLVDQSAARYDLTDHAAPARLLADQSGPATESTESGGPRYSTES